MARMLLYAKTPMQDGKYNIMFNITGFVFGPVIWLCNFT